MSILLAAMITLAQAKQEACTNVGELAAATMTARQRGIPMSKLYEINEGNPIGQVIVRDAYATPRFQSPEYVQRAVEDFRDAKFAMCLDMLK
jgi:hypothetical protein